MLLRMLWGTLMTWLQYGYLGTLNACDQWPIDLTLKNRLYFVFIAEFVERLPTIFPVNIWGTYLFEIEHRWAKWLISDPLPHGTCWINDPMIRLQIAQISDSINPCPEWTWSITGLKMDLLERNAIDQKSWSGFSQRNASLVRKLFIYFFYFQFFCGFPPFFSFFYIFFKSSL